MDTRKGYFYNNVNSNCKVMVKIIVKLKCFFSHMQKFNHTIMDERNQIGIWNILEGGEMFTPADLHSM